MDGWDEANRRLGLGGEWVRGCDGSSLDPMSLGDYGASIYQQWVKRWVAGVFQRVMVITTWPWMSPNGRKEAALGLGCASVVSINRGGGFGGGDRQGGGDVRQQLEEAIG